MRLLSLRGGVPSTRDDDVAISGLLLQPQFKKLELNRNDRAFIDFLK